jgi:signal transduction histidine kinase
MRQALRRDSIWLDALAALAVLVAGVVGAAVSDATEGPIWANAAIWLAVAVAMFFRRRRPVPAGYAFLALMGLSALTLTSPADGVLPLFGLLLFPNAVAAHATGPAARAYPIAAVGLVLLVDAEAGLVNFGDIVFPSVLAVASWTAGRSAQSRLRLSAELHEAALRAEEGREADARRAVSAERARIVREMHDVVAHSISVMVVQAGGARRIIERDTDRAEAAATEIERTGRQALLEMRRLLGVLRGPEQTGQLAPTPTFDGLGALVGRARTAGLPVELHVDGDSRPLPAGIDLAAYRIVQEALTNVLEHAPGALTRVNVRWLPDALEIHVTDSGPGPRRPGAPEEAGQGIIGMRERVALYGGDIRTGRRRGGGFEVHVRLPLEASDQESASQAPVAAQGAA